MMDYNEAYEFVERLRNQLINGHLVLLAYTHGIITALKALNKIDDIIEARLLINYNLAATEHAHNNLL